jgi:cation transport regulator
MTQEQATQDAMLQQKTDQSAATSDNVTMNPEEQLQAGEQFSAVDQSAGFLTLESLPEDVRNVLPTDAQQIFVAAYNSIFEGNHDREAANRVAWQSIEYSEQFAKGSDGTWHHARKDEVLHSPSPTTSA